MKTLEFENKELNDLSIDELRKIDGGIIGLDDIAAGVVGWVICEVIDGCIRYAAGERKR